VTTDTEAEPQTDAGQAVLITGKALLKAIAATLADPTVATVLLNLLEREIPKVEREAAAQERARGAMTTETLTAPVETVTPIKPSEALRLGRVLMPREVAGDYFDGLDGACAIGAMAVGWGFEFGFLAVERLDEVSEIDTLSEAVIDINDHAPAGHRDDAVIAFLVEHGL
jgi:hypothetical protein